MSTALKWVAGIAGLLAVVAGTLVLDASLDEMESWEERCEQMDAKFVEEPSWICVRDGEIIYPEEYQ